MSHEALGVVLATLLLVGAMPANASSLVDEPDEGVEKLWSPCYVHADRGYEDEDGDGEEEYTGEGSFYCDDPTLA